MPVVTTSSKKQILLAAERLFAVHGIEGISLRQIGAAAGNGNNSAVQYHFGSKDRLIQAIFEYRLPWLHQRRLDLMAERGASDLRDLRGLVECQVRPLMEHSEVADSYYLTFVAMLKQYGRRDIFACIPEPMRTSSREFQEQLAMYLPYIAEPLRTNRIAQAMSLVVEATAERQRAHAADQPVLPFEVHLMDLLDAIIGFMTAMVSTQTLDALAHTTPAPLSWARFI